MSYIGGGKSCFWMVVLWIAEGWASATDPPTNIIPNANAASALVIDRSQALYPTPAQAVGFRTADRPMNRKKPPAAISAKPTAWFNVIF